MKYLSSFFLAFLMLNIAMSQNYFNNLYGYGNLVEFDSDVILFDNDLVTIGGALHSNQLRGMLIRKLNENGNLLWEDFIIDDTLSLSPRKDSRHISFINKADLYIFCMAVKWSTTELEYTLPVLIKYNILRKEVIFKKTYRIGHSAGMYSMILKDDYIYAVGNTTLVDGYRNSDGLIMKLDLEGNVIWQKSTDYGIGEYMYEIEPLGENLIIAGAQTKEEFSSRPFLLKIDTTGNTIKKNEPVIYGGSGVSDIEIIEDNIYYLVETEELVHEFPTQLLGLYNKNLELQWDTLIENTSKYYLSGRRMEILNNQIIIAGNIRGAEKFTSNKVWSYAYSLSLEGHLNWEHVYRYDDEFIHHIDDIKALPNGDLVFMSTVFDNVNNTDIFTDQYLWLFRTDSLGCGTVQETCYYTIDDYFMIDTVTNIIEPQFSTTTPVQILGNPFTTNLQLTTNESKPLQLKFYNTAGQLFSTKNLSNQLSLNT